MSYTIVDGVEICNGKVYISATSNNVSPTRFTTYEADTLSKIHQKDGMEGVLKWLAVLQRDGEVRLNGTDPICKHIREGMNLLPNDLLAFLDDEKLGDFIRDYAISKMKGKRFNSKKRLETLQALRDDEKQVLDICRTRPESFACASQHVQCDKTAAMEYIKQCGGMIMFCFPRHFAGDREVAVMAFKMNGCTYRQLHPSLQKDKEIVELAFNSEMDRYSYEDIPDVIPEILRSDRVFMKKIIRICPGLHISRTPDILKDRDCALTWVEYGKWVLNELHLLPKEYLEDSEFQKSLNQRYPDPESQEKLKKAYLSM